MTQISSGDTFPFQRKQDPMARVRCFTEMGMGVDVHGRDATKAASRAVSEAIRHSSVGLFRMVGWKVLPRAAEMRSALPTPPSSLVSTMARRARSYSSERPGERSYHEPIHQTVVDVCRAGGGDPFIRASGD